MVPTAIVIAAGEKTKPDMSTRAEVVSFVAGADGAEAVGTVFDTVGDAAGAE